MSKHYKLPMIGADKLALGVLVWTAGRIYVPKLVAIKARKSAVHDAPGAASVPIEPIATYAEPPVAEWFSPVRPH